MPITQRGTSWQAQVNHKGVRWRRAFNTKVEAQAWEADAKARLLRGENPEMREQVQSLKSIPTALGALIEHVYDTHWRTQKAGDKSRINALGIATLIGTGKRVTQVTRHDIDKARAALLDQGNSPATVNRKVAALLKVLGVAEDTISGYRKPKTVKYRESEHRIRRFTRTEEEQAQSFFDMIGQQDMIDYVVISLGTGMRQGEVLALRWAQVEADKITLWGDGTKSGKGRSIPLTTSVKGVLARRRKDAPSDGRVFSDLSKRSVTHYWNRFREAMGLEHDTYFVPHIMRHEFCSRLADQGVNAAVIQQLAGHSSLVVTQRYIHVAAHSLVAPIKGLEGKASAAA
jgi:integrase